MMNPELSENTIPVLASKKKQDATCFRKGKIGSRGE